MYDDGYAAVREARYERLVESGLIDEETYPLSEPTHRDWDTLSTEERADQARRMEVYAAMIDRMDQNIGRLIEELERRGELENTLFMFASDNGASAEVVRIGDGPIGKTSTTNKIRTSSAGNCREKPRAHWTLTTPGPFARRTCSSSGRHGTSTAVKERAEATILLH